MKTNRRLDLTDAVLIALVAVIFYCFVQAFTNLGAR